MFRNKLNYAFLNVTINCEPAPVQAFNLLQALHASLENVSAIIQMAWHAGCKIKCLQILF